MRSGTKLIYIIFRHNWLFFVTKEISHVSITMFYLAATNFKLIAGSCAFILTRLMGVLFFCMCMRFSKMYLGAHMPPLPIFPFRFAGIWQTDTFQPHSLCWMLTTCLKYPVECSSRIFVNVLKVNYWRYGESIQFCTCSPYISFWSNRGTFMQLTETGRSCFPACTGWEMF